MKACQLPSYTNFPYLSRGIGHKRILQKALKRGREKYSLEDGEKEVCSLDAFRPVTRQIFPLIGRKSCLKKKRRHPPEGKTIL